MKEKFIMSAMPIPFQIEGMQHKNVAVFPDNEFYAALNQGAFMLSSLSYSLALSCIAKYATFTLAAWAMTYGDKSYYSLHH
jgi:hypothetical protein